METITKSELEIKIEPIKLEYKQINSGIKNILLIDDTVYQNEILFDSVNSDTLAIKYNYNSDKNELEKLLTDNFEFINRIGFVFDDSLMKSKQFMNTELFFTQDDLTETQTEYSNNLKFIIEIIKKFNISNLDYLVCGGLKHDNWVKYFSILNKETGVIIGASNDETGNIKYGGDWILESTNEDVKNIYWNEEISNYTSTLVTTTISGFGIIQLRQSSSTALIEYRINSGSWISIGTNWPVNFINTDALSTLTVSFTTDLTISNTPLGGPGTNGYFIIGSEKIILDGGNKTITINGVDTYPGLVLNGTSSSNGYSNITIQNINVSTSNGSTIAFQKGWICWDYFGKASSNNQVTNCSSSGAISNQYSGGIFGFGSSGSAVNCYSSGVISGLASGGIFGFGSSGSAVNCYSSGIISNAYTGGIFSYGSSGSAVNCYSSGVINGYSSGGIFAYGSSGSAVNCYSLGAISGTESGGIFGSYSTGTATNCYSSGAISGTNSGGIFAFNSTGTATNCYIANNSWSDSDANLKLIETPTLINPYGNVWTDYGLVDNTPYNLTSNLNNYYTTSTGGIYGLSKGVSTTIYYINNTSIISGRQYTLNVNSVGYTSTALSNGTIGFTFTPNFLGYKNMNISDNSIGTQIASKLVIKVLNNIINTNTTITNTDISTYVWPITILGGTSSNVVTITLGTDITLNSSSEYFIIGSQYIIFDGGNKTITINGVTNYPGLVLNGTSSSNGYSNITIQNINVSTSNGSTIAFQKGWICWDYFGKASSNNQVTNCSSSGAINGNLSGGIFGSSSSGSAVNCYSSGAINGNLSGGIFGAGSSGSAVNCYSTSAISGNETGGIFGSYSSGRATNCYSSGAISGTNSGGIFGYNSSTNRFGFDPSPGSATNCYSCGSISGTDSGGIFGINSTGAATNCYIANNTWSDSTASSNLTGTPIYDSSGSLVNPVGTTWIDIAPTNNNTPWLFSTFGFTPYTSTLSTTFTQTLGKYQQSSSPALNPTGHTYSIISINNQLPSLFPTISIISSDPILGGSINRTNEITPLGTYNIKVMQNSDYSITNFVLVLTSYCFNEGTKILCYKNGVEEYIKIEELKKGDLVKTLKNGYVPINAMGTNTMQNNPLSDKGSMYKYNDLIVTGCHMLLKDWEKKDRNKYVRNSLVDNKYRLMACQDSRFTKIVDNKIYTIYNLVLEGGRQYGILAEGILTETAKKRSILNGHLKKIE
jgi:hypothetical protein